MARDALAAIYRQLDDHERRLSALESALQAKQTSGEPARKRISLKEFILSKKPKDDVQRTLAIGYFLEKYEEFSRFNSKDLTTAFRSSKEKVPLNVSDKLQMNVKKGHMMDSGEKKDNMKSYVLTSSGEQLVENNFQKEG